MKEKGKTSQKNNVKSAGSRSVKRAGPADRPVKMTAQMEARFRAVFESSRDAIGISKAGVHVSVNPAYRELFGLPPDTDIAGKPVLDLVAPASRDQVREYLAHRARGGSAPAIYETRGLRVDGSEFDMEVNVSAYQEMGEDHTLVILRDITRRKMAEEEIAERGAMVQQIMDTASVAIFLVDKVGQIIHANRRMAEMFGCAIEELEGSEYVAHVHPSERETGRKKMLALLASKIPSVDLERLYWRKDGTAFWGHLAGRRFYDIRGNELGLIGVITDIDKRKQAEEKMKEGEEKYTFLVEATNTGYVIIDSDGLVVDANQEYVRLSGHERLEDILHRSVAEWTAPHDRERNAKEVVKCAERGFVRNLEIDYVDKHGRFTPVEINATITRRDDAVRIFTLCRDITGRKQAEVALKESEAKYRRLYNETPVMLHSIDRSGAVVEVNDHWVNTLGYGRDEVIGRKVTDFFTDESRKYAQEVVQPAFVRDGTVKDISYQFVKKNGEIVDVLLSATSERDDAGNVVRSLAVIQDITERLRAEHALRESEEKFSKIFRKAPLLITLSEVETGRFLDVNEKFLEISGFAREEVMGKTAFEIGWISEEQRARMLQTIRERSRVSGMELSLRRKDSGEVICLYNGEIITVGGTQRLLSIAQDITELKRTDEALRESEDRFRSIFENAIDGIMIADAGTRTNIEVNKAMCRMLGYTRDEIIGSGIADLHPKKDMPDVLQTFERQLCGETSLAEDIPMLRKDGTIFYADINAAAVTVGGKQCMMGIFRDISERKRAEEEKDRLAQAVSIVTEGIAITDEEDRFIYLNDAHAKMYGYTQSELVGKTWRDVTPRELVPSIEKELSRALHSRKNGVWSGEAPGLCKDGTEIATEIAATARWDEKGDYLGHICVVRDIAERKRAEGELREKEQKYRLLFESANDGIFIQDETGFADCNQKGAEMYGLPKAEIIGRSPREFAPERQPDGRLSAEVAGEKIRAALSGVPQMFEWQPLRADGSTFNVEITLNRLELGGKVCLQAIVRDISERKRLEQEHLKSEKLQSIGTLAGGIAHDFNNLLQGVFGYISMAKLIHDQKEKSLSMLEQAEKALHRSVSLTSQLLTFSKGGKPLKKVIDPKPLIENAVKFALSGSRVDYALSFDDDLCPVEADEGQLGQVVQNIVLNAEQAMPLGGRIEITARNVLASSLAGVPAASSGDLVEITIRDQGMGIPPEHLPKIFDPYFTTKEKGSGLGLATSYSIIKNHDGAINVTSELGKGTTFTVYFPAARQEGEESPGPAAPPVARKGRVLVMDDEELVRRVAYELLTGLGHGVELAVHGGEAVEKYRQAKSAGRPFDVVILDLTIRGGMGGEEAMRKLLEIDPGVKAIVSSGYSNDSVVANYRDHGFAAFLKKPYDLTDLQSTLNALLGE